MTAQGFVSVLGMLAATASQAGQLSVYEVDSNASSAHFEVVYFGSGVVRGMLGNIKGSVELDDASKEGVAIMAFDMNTVETGRAMLNSLIKSRHIFDTATFPDMHFRSNYFEFRGPQLVSASGMLTLHGVTRPIHLQVRNFSCSEAAPPIPARARCNGNFHTVISRSQFGMNQLSLLVEDDVLISVDLSLRRRDQPAGATP